MKRLKILILVLAALTSIILSYPLISGSYESSTRPRVVVWYDRIEPELLVEVAPELAIVEAEELDEVWVRYLHQRGVEVIAYVNFGMAEEWRKYWREEWENEPPPWMGPESGEWGGEHLVMFWEDEWLRIIEEIIGELVENGYDGILLDNIDVCEYWSMRGYDGINLLLASLKRVREGFEGKLYANLGTAIQLVYENEFQSIVDGVMREEVWFSYRGAVDEEEREEVLKALIYFKKLGKDVIIVDYTDEPSQIQYILERCDELGFRCFVGSRELDELPSYISA